MPCRPRNLFDLMAFRGEKPTGTPLDQKILESFFKEQQEGCFPPVRWLVPGFGSVPYLTSESLLVRV